MEHIPESVNPQMTFILPTIVFYNVSDQVNYLQAKLLNGITDRISKLETKVVQVESTNNTFGKWIDTGFKVVVTVVSGIILYKLFGIS